MILHGPEYDCGWQVVNNGHIQDYTYPDDYIPLFKFRTWILGYEFKPFTVFC